MDVFRMVSDQIDNIHNIQNYKQWIKINYSNKHYGISENYLIMELHSFNGYIAH